MPKGDPGGYFRKGSARLASAGKGASRAVAGSRMGKFARRHPIISASMGMAGMGGIASGKRRSGLNTVVGRPTGMFGY